MEPNRNLAGYCGLYCGACDIHLLAREGEASGKPPAWSDLPERFRKHLHVKDKPVACQGCRSDAVFAGCSICPLRKCAKGRGLQGFCTDCADYPCMKLRLLGLVSRLMRFEKKLPHQKSKAANLERARCVGMDTWLEEQAQRWRCPACHAPYSWYRSTCACGHELDSLKGFL